MDKRIKSSESGDEMHDILQERIQSIRQEIIRLEAEIRNLSTNFDKSTIRQGERLGSLERGLVEREVDFRWAMRFGVGLIAFIQGIAIAIIGFWLNRAEADRSKLLTSELASIRREVNEVKGIRSALDAMGIDINAIPTRRSRSNEDRSGR